MESACVLELLVLLKGLVSHSYRIGLKVCPKDLLPKEIQENLEVVMPTLMLWQQRGCIKLNGYNHNFFEILKDIE